MAQAALRIVPLPNDDGVVACTAYADGRRVADLPIEEAGDWARRPGHVVWIGLLEPDDALLRRVQAQFNLHELAINDAMNAHQRPKLEQYGDAHFVVARTAQMLEGRIAFGETHLFIGRGYVVSVRHGASSSYAAVRERCEACPSVLARGEHYIAYAILDFIVDNYAPVIESIGAEVEEIEDVVLLPETSQGEIERLYNRRRDLLRLRRAVVPLVEVCRRIEHASGIEESMRLLFRDVTDHVHRIQEEIDTLREVLTFAFDASVMTAQNQQTITSRRLAAYAALLAVPTMVAGIYGMNFKHMPELEWEYGYYTVMILVALATAAIYWRLKRVGWV